MKDLNIAIGILTRYLSGNIHCDWNIPHDATSLCIHVSPDVVSVVDKRRLLDVGFVACPRGLSFIYNRRIIR